MVEHEAQFLFRQLMEAIIYLERQYILHRSVYGFFPFKLAKFPFFQRPQVRKHIPGRVLQCQAGRLRIHTATSSWGALKHALPIKALCCIGTFDGPNLQRKQRGYMERRSMLVGLFILLIINNI